MAQQAMNENGQKIFEIFRQGEEKVCVASLARWNAQLKGPAEMEKKCQNMMQELKLLSEGKKYCRAWWNTKTRCRAEQRINMTSRFFEEMKELEGKKSKEVQKKHILMRYQNVRDEARRLQRSGRDKEGGGLTGPSRL